MTANTIAPCLWFDVQAEQAARFYIETFQNGSITAVSRYPSSIDNPGGKPRGSVLTVEFELGGLQFTAVNGGHGFTINPTISFFAHAHSATEAAQIFDKFAAKGKVLMPLGQYPWSECYGWVEDSFGVSWQVITGRRTEHGADIVPCLMFTGEVHGKAEQAIQTYTKIFPESAIRSLEHYEASEAPPETLKHGRFTLAGQSLVAMDSHLAQGFSFTEGLSLQVMCKDQAEVDQYWNKLSEGGSPGPCGWLKDRFGVWWQVVPKAMRDFMTSADGAAKDRTFAAMLSMTKLDIAVLEAAYRGS